MSRVRAVTIAMAGMMVAAPTYALYVVAMAYVLLSSVASGCGFDAGSDCTDANANEVSTTVFAVIVTLFFVFVLTVLLRLLIRRGLRPTGRSLGGWRLVVLSLTLGLLPVLAGGAALARGSHNIWNSAVPLVLIAGVAAWSELLRRMATPERVEADESVPR